MRRRDSSDSHSAEQAQQTVMPEEPTSQDGDQPEPRNQSSTPSQQQDTSGLWSPPQRKRPPAGIQTSSESSAATAQPNPTYNPSPMSPDMQDRVFPIRSVVTVDPNPTPSTRSVRSDVDGFFHGSQSGQLSWDHSLMLGLTRIQKSLHQYLNRQHPFATEKKAIMASSRLVLPQIVADRRRTSKAAGEAHFNSRWLRIWRTTRQKRAGVHL